MPEARALGLKTQRFIPKPHVVIENVSGIPEEPIIKEESDIELMKRNL